MPPVVPSRRADLRQVGLLALPVVVANLLQSVVGVVDVFMVGRLGPVEIAAVGMGNAVRMLVLVMILSVTAGAQALAAQARGARDPERLSTVTRQTLSLALLLSLVLGAIGVLAAEPVLAFLNSDGDPRAVTLGADYLAILFAGTLFLTGNFAINSLFQGAGDTVTPLWLSGGVNLLNVLFNALLIFGPGPLPALGVAGAALGTVLARACGVGAGLAILYAGRSAIRILPGSYRPDWRLFGDILAIGVPSGLQGVVRNSAQLLVLRIVTSTAAGTYGATALAIGLQVESLAFMPGLAIGVAATSLVGQSLGAWQTRDAERRGTAALVLGAGVMTAVAVPMWLFAPQLVRLFDPSAHPTVVAAGTSYLRINALSQPVLAVAMVLGGALRGAGDTRPALVGTVLGRWLTVVPLAYLLALRLDWGVEGVWWSLLAGTAVQAAWIGLRWRSRRWQGVALRGSELWRRHLRGLEPGTRARFLREVRAPLLARAGAREVLEPGGVRYLVGGDEDLRVRFGPEGGYEVVPVPARPAPPAAPAPARTTPRPFRP